MYQCVADNGVNNIYQTAYLDVQGMMYLVDYDSDDSDTLEVKTVIVFKEILMISVKLLNLFVNSAEKPVFDMNTSKATLFLEAKGIIKCHAKAAPTAKNTWKKDEVDIDFSLPRYKLVNNEDLVIGINIVQRHTVVYVYTNIIGAEKRNESGRTLFDFSGCIDSF